MQFSIYILCVFSFGSNVPVLVECISKWFDANCHLLIVYSVYCSAVHFTKSFVCLHRVQSDLPNFIVRLRISLALREREKKKRNGIPNWRSLLFGSLLILYFRLLLLWFWCHHHTVLMRKHCSPFFTWKLWFKHYLEISGHTLRDSSPTERIKETTSDSVSQWAISSGLWNY